MDICRQGFRIVHRGVWGSTECRAIWVNWGKKTELGKGLQSGTMVYVIFGQVILARKALVRGYRSQARSDKGEGTGGGGGGGDQEAPPPAPPPRASSNPDDASLNIVIATKVSQEPCSSALPQNRNSCLPLPGWLAEKHSRDDAFKEPGAVAVYTHTQGSQTARTGQC